MDSNLREIAPNCYNFLPRYEAIFGLAESEYTNTFGIYWSQSGEYLALINANVCYIFTKNLTLMQKINAADRIYLNLNEERFTKTFDNFVWSADASLFALNFGKSTDYEIFLIDNANNKWNTVRNSKWTRIANAEQTEKCIGFLPQNNYFITDTGNFIKINNLDNNFIQTVKFTNKGNAKKRLRTDGIIEIENSYPQRGGTPMLMSEFINLNNIAQVYEYFSNPMQLEELILLQAIELARYAETEYNLDLYWLDVFNNLGNEYGDEFSKRLRYLLKEFVKLAK